jgi:thymidylate synthase
MNPIDRQYLDMVGTVLNGERRPSRTGTDTYSVFAYHYTVPLTPFPIITTKRVNFKAVLEELFWFLSGSTNVNDMDSKIWNEWAREDGETGNLYGYQWVNWEQYVDRNDGTGFVDIHKINQIDNVINSIKNDPYGRRHIVTAWNPGDLYRHENDPKKPILPSCHAFFCFYVTTDLKLNCHLTQRSADVALGVPFNIASYAALTYMIAAECELELGEFSHYMNDCHIYVDHVDGLRKQCRRSSKGGAPQLIINPETFWELKPDDLTLLDYQPHKSIKFKIAV